MEQTPSSEETPDPDTTRIDAYLAQFARLVTTHDLTALRYLIADGAYSHHKFVSGVCALGWHQIGKLRVDANLRYLYHGLNDPAEVAKRPMTAKSTGTTSRALSAWKLTTPTSCCIIRYATM